MRGVAVLCAGTVLAYAQVARAQDPADFPATGSLSDVVSGAEQTRPFWSGSGPTRPFVSATFGVGIVNFLTRAQLGYGKPHYSWVGIEGGPQLSVTTNRVYGGLRAKHTNIDFRAGARFESQLNQNLLPAQRHFQREDLETDLAGPSRYLVAEAELNGNVPFPGGSLLAVITGMFISGIPDERYVWEQVLRTVVAPPWVWRARLGYLAHIGWAGSMKLGVAAEVIHIPLREMLVIRAGPLVSVGLTHHLEVNGGLMIVAASRDDIGLPAADLGQLALVYKWALGDRWAEFP